MIETGQNHEPFQCFVAVGDHATGVVHLAAYTREVKAQETVPRIELIGDAPQSTPSKARQRNFLQMLTDISKVLQ